MITLTPPIKTDATLRAIAASGVRGMVQPARDELTRRMHERLAWELRR